MEYFTREFIAGLIGKPLREIVQVGVQKIVEKTVLAEFEIFVRQYFGFIGRQRHARGGEQLLGKETLISANTVVRLKDIWEEEYLAEPNGFGGEALFVLGGGRCAACFPKIFSYVHSI